MTGSFGAKCLMARRLVERGVRFVQVWSGGTGAEGDWDGHKACDKNHLQMAAKTDRPIGALLADLKSRGLLDTTLVIWGGEFGRTPVSDGNMNGARRSRRPRSQSVRLHDLDGGRRRQGGKVIGAPTRSACARSTIRCMFTTCTRRFFTCWEWITRG